MSTWAELTTQVFYNLELDPATTGDQKSAVQNALQNTLIQIANDYQIRELTTITSPVAMTSATTSIALGGGGFAVTNLAEIIFLSINYLPSDATSEDEVLEEVSYITWKRQNNVSTGDVRRDGTWTLTPSNTFLFANLPGTGETWNAYLTYQKTVAAFVEGSTPELGSQHHNTLALGATTNFPQYFKGDRTELFLKFQKEYNTGLERIKMEQRSRASMREIRSRKRTRTWGRIRWT